jgi:hypothetical protein
MRKMIGFLLISLLLPLSAQAMGRPLHDDVLFGRLTLEPGMDIVTIEGNVYGSYLVTVLDKGLFYIYSPFGIEGPFDDADYEMVHPEKQLYLFTAERESKRRLVLFGPWEENRDFIEENLGDDYEVVLYESDRFPGFPLFRAVSGEYEEIWQVQFSFTKKRLEYIALNDSGWCFVYGKVKYGPYSNADYINIYSDYIEPYFYVRRENEYLYVLGDEEYGWFEDFQPFRFSDNRENCFYGIKRPEGWYVIINEKEKGPYEDIWLWGFLEPESLPVYAVLRNGKQYLYVGKEEKGPYDWINWDYEFSPDNSVLAYKVKIDNEWFIIKGNKRIGPFSGVHDMKFSRDSTIFVYAARTGTGSYVFIGDRQLGPYEDIYWLAFSPDNRILSFLFRDNGKIYVASYQSPFRTTCFGPFDDAGFPFFNDDKNYSFCMELDGEHYIYYNGEIRQGPFDLIVELKYCYTIDQPAGNVEKDGCSYMAFNDSLYGPYDCINLYWFLSDGSCLFFAPIIDGIYHTRVIVDSCEYPGNTVLKLIKPRKYEGLGAIYYKGGDIFFRAE